MAITISIDEFAHMTRYELLKPVRAAMERSFVQGGKVIARNTKSEIRRTRPYPPIWTGAMLDSVRSFPIPGGSQIEVGVPHAKYMEYGARPFTPPMGPLVSWASDKFPSKTPSEVVQFAFAVRRQIQKRGIRPRFFFRKAIRRSIPRIKIILERNMKRAERQLARRASKMKAR